MKTTTHLLIPIALATSLLVAQAQFGGGPGPGRGQPPSGPKFTGATKKLFGEHPAFTANTEVQSPGDKPGEEVVVPGKLAYHEGKSRFEMEMSEMKGAKMPPGAAEQMKQMGMDKMVIISVPEKKLSYLIYPGLEAYVEMPETNPDAAKPASDFDSKVTELGKESVAGHDCAKSKVEVSDKEGKKHEFTVWNAHDLKKFPVKIESKEGKSSSVTLFKDVKFAKPEASQFAPPATYKKYDSMMSMMQAEMMKRMGGGMEMPR